MPPNVNRYEQAVIETILLYQRWAVGDGPDVNLTAEQIARMMYHRLREAVTAR